MQLTWLAYVLALSLLAGAAALWAERILFRFKRQVRFAWLAAIAASVLLPLAAFFFPRVSDQLVYGVGTWLTARGLPAIDAVRQARIQQYELARGLPDLQTLLLVTWSAVAVLLCAWFAHGILTLSRRRRGWREEELEGRRCLVSGDTGPAVVGVLRHRLVVPSWVADLDTDQREMVLAHEEEHLRRGDHWLLAAGYLGLALFPWNPVLWWQVRRLRLAVELDCDRRVTREIGDLSRYARLLLKVARGERPAPTTAFARGEPQVELRIRHVLDPDRPGTLATTLRTLALVSVAALALLVPRPIFPARSAADLPSELSEVGPTPHDVAPKCLNCDAVRHNLQDPPLRGSSRDPTPIFVYVHITDSGTVDRAIAKLASDLSPPLPPDSLRALARRLRFQPALWRGSPTAVWFAVPLVFGNGSH